MASPLDRHPDTNIPTSILPSAELPQELRPGSRLDKYILLERLGAGGMGEVFKALHETMQRVVAVKVMAPHIMVDARARARFLREARSAARLVHPNIVLAFDAGEQAERCFLVMEYVEGWDAAALMRTGGLPGVPLACEIIRQAALGLHHAYEQGVIHRDIKPGNLIVAPRRHGMRESSASGGMGEVPHPESPSSWPTEPMVKILDLGLARFVEGGGDEGPPVPVGTPLTREGFVVGTPEFMSPEQATNSRQLDIRSDIYSLGCTLYCLLTGRPPFTGNSLLEVMVQHMQKQPEPATVHRPGLPPEVSAILVRTLSKKPEDRFQTPLELAEALAPLGLSTETGFLPSGVGGSVPNTLTEPVAGPTPLGGGSTEMMPAAGQPGTARLAPQPAPRPPQKSGSPLMAFAIVLMVVAASALGGYYFFFREDGTEELLYDDPIPISGVGISLMPFPSGPSEPSYAPPRTSVEIPQRFLVATTEVTKGQFRQFITETGYRTTAEELARAGKVGPDVLWHTQLSDENEKTAVVGVSWEDAVRFCNWLSKRDGKPLCYEEREGAGGGWDCKFNLGGYRLPTEAEWEYAAAQGKRTLFPDGDLAKFAILREDGKSAAQTVATRAANGRRLHDMWGNVWEWCWDWYVSPVRPPVMVTGPESGSSRVARGGGWGDPASSLRQESGTRKGLRQDHHATDLGFRVARTSTVN